MSGTYWTPERRAAKSEAMKVNWASRSEGERAALREKISRDNLANPRGHLKNHAFPPGTVPANKGNNWRDALTPEQVRAIVAERARKRRAANPKTKVNDKVSALVRYSLKRVGLSKQGKAWPAVLGYSFETLKDHLESTLPEGRRWEDYVEGRLELDHIQPISSFLFSSMEDEGFKRCWALSNLRLLSREDNYFKRHRLMSFVNF